MPDLNTDKPVVRPEISRAVSYALERCLRFVGPVIRRRLQREQVRFVSLTILAVSLVVLIVAFASVDGGRTAFGSDLGSDYAGFFSAAALLNQFPSDQLYNFELQDRLYHQVLPALGQEEKLPYLHPPFVAFALRPLAQLPYTWSFAIWLILSLSFYVAGLFLMLKPLRTLTVGDRVTILLLALSFEPFIMECWLNGQLSSFGMFCMALACYCLHSERPTAAGLVLGLCLYKPTLLFLLLPMLLIGRRWRMLAGFALTALFLAGISLLAVGWKGCLDYADVLFGFARSTTGGGAALRTYKYVDLNSFLRMLFGADSRLRWGLFLIVVGPPLGVLAVAWSRTGPVDGPRRQLTLASTLTWTLVANLYVGVYDTVLVVPAVLLALKALPSRPGGDGPALLPGFQALLVLLYVVPWVSPHLASWAGFQSYTLVLLALAVYLQAPVGWIPSVRFAAVRRTARLCEPPLNE
jgi:hypothetical protein